MCMHMNWFLVLVSTQGALGDGDLMLICIAPDHEGKFGFNVKVGRSLTLNTHDKFHLFTPFMLSSLSCSI